MRFVKMHGLGNDFLMIDARAGFPAHEAALARRWCERRFGVGADGLLLLLESATCDWRCRILNSDGSEAEMCGNGIRCFAKYLRDSGLEARDSFTVETLAGTIRPQLLEHRPDVAVVRVDMGEPRLRPEDIPFLGDPGAEQVVAALLPVDDDPWSITCVSMGNPHCVLFVDDLQALRVEWWGPLIERHERFPKGTNVEFVQVHDRGHATMHVWERGAGRTLACGTGACATLVAGVLNDLLDRQATIHLEGGDLQIQWRESDGRLLMTGPAATVFAGEIAP